MVERKHGLIADHLPPLTLEASWPSQPGRIEPLSRMGRLAWLLTALSLPVLGLTLADLVHRMGESGTMQAAAPMPPSTGAAAPSRLTRTGLIRAPSPNPVRRGDRA